MLRSGGSPLGARGHRAGQLGQVAGLDAFRCQRAPPSGPGRLLYTAVVTASDAKMLHVLVVEDDPLVRSALARTLARHYSVSVAATVEHALEAASASRMDVVIADLNLGDPEGRSGFWLLDELCDGRVTRGLVLTGQSTSHARHRVLRKPATSAALRTAIETVAAAAPQAEGKPSEVE